MCVQNQKGEKTMKQKLTHKLAAVMTAGAMLSEATAAFAGPSNTTFKTMSQNIVTSSGGLPGMISTVAYIGGVGLGVAGVFKLKQHVDNPGQTPMKDGLIRLGAGGGLLALPFLTGAMMGSINNGTNTQATETLMLAPAAIP
jgi:hypothetical protein